jgi:hypothetical protein
MEFYAKLYGNSVEKLGLYQQKYGFYTSIYFVPQTCVVESYSKKDVIRVGSCFTLNSIEKFKVVGFSDSNLCE